MIIFLPPRYDDDGEPIPYGPTLGDLMDLTWKDWLWILGFEVVFWAIVAGAVFIMKG